jgi:hypothetical protein
VGYGVEGPAIIIAHMMLFRIALSICHRTACATALVMLPAAMQLTSAKETGKRTQPLVIKDRHMVWYEASAFGGGAEAMMDAPEQSDRHLGPSLEFLDHATPQITVGCSNSRPGAGHWRFLVRFARSGNAINTIREPERAFGSRVIELTGLPGSLILLNERGEKLHQIPLKTGDAALETGPLDMTMLRKITDASEFQVRTPRLLIIGDGLYQISAVLRTLQHKGSPCGEIR